MNFLFLCSARKWGGNEKWVWMTTQALAEKNHKTMLAYRREVIGERFEVPSIRLPFLNEADLYTILRIAGIVRRHSIDILISTKPKDYVIAGLVAKILKRKNVVRLGIVRDLKNSPIKRLGYDWLNDGIIVNAQPIKEALLKSKYMKSNKIRVIHNGVDIERIEQLAREETTLKKPFEFMFCSMGELSERKRFSNFLRGLALFLKSTDASNVGAVIIGDGDKLLALERLARDLGIERHVLFTGFLTNPYPLLSNCDVYVSTSENEGISNALLEAMYLKLPIIASSSGGTDCAVIHGRNGYLLNAADHIDQISNYMRDLYENRQLCRQFAGESHEIIREKFSLPRMVSDIVSFCEEL